MMKKESWASINGRKRPVKSAERNRDAGTGVWEPGTGVRGAHVWEKVPTHWYPSPGLLADQADGMIFER